MNRCSLTILITSLVFVVSQGQSLKEPTGRSVYGAVFFEEGASSYPPIQKRKLHNARTANIPLNDSTVALSLTWGTNEVGAAQFWLLNKRADNTAQLVYLTFNSSEDYTLSAIAELSLGSNPDVLFPLELRVVPNSRLLLYRWVGSNSSSVAYGGRPTLEESLLLVGSPLPQFPLQTLDGRETQLPSEPGAVLVINWWAVSCAPCVEEMPGLNKLVQEFAGQNIRFVAIANNTPSEVKDFLKKRDFLYVQTIAKDSTVKIFGESYPRNVVVDRDSKVVFDRTGATSDTYKDLERVIEQLLNTPSGGTPREEPQRQE